MEMSAAVKEYLGNMTGVRFALMMYSKVDDEDRDVVNELNAIVTEGNEIQEERSKEFADLYGKYLSREVEKYRER